MIPLLTNSTIKSIATYVNRDIVNGEKFFEFETTFSFWQKKNNDYSVMLSNTYTTKMKTDRIGAIHFISLFF